MDSAAAGGSNKFENIERFLVFCVLGLVSAAGCVMVSVTFLFMVSGCYRTAAFSPIETVTMKNTSGRFRDELSKYIYIYIYTHNILYRDFARFRRRR